MGVPEAHEREAYRGLAQPETFRVGRLPRDHAREGAHVRHHHAVERAERLRRPRVARRLPGVRPYLQRHGGVHRPRELPERRLERDHAEVETHALRHREVQPLHPLPGVRVARLHTPEGPRSRESGSATWKSLAYPVWD